MGGQSPAAGNFRDRMHELLRASILDAAWDAAANNDWLDVRISDLAAKVGVSRQTIHNEFGSKDQLAMALFARDLEYFIEGVSERLRSADSLPGAVGSAYGWMMTEVAGHAVVQRVIRASRDGRAADMLLLLTVRADRIIGPMRTSIAQVCAARFGVALDEAMRVADSIVRLGLSQVVYAPDLHTAEEMVEIAVDLVMAQARRQRRSAVPLAVNS